MIQKKTFLFICILVFWANSVCFSQKAVLRGKVTDEKGEALAFATLHLKNTTIGTTTNAEGIYSLQIAIGDYEVMAQYPGHKSISQKINLQEAKEYLLNFILPAEGEIQAITVQAQAINYADEVIRNAQKNRKKYLEERPDYQCKVYVKGLARLNEKPKQILGESTAGLDTGIVYLSESISEVSYQRSPRKYKEVVVASKVSGDSKGFSFNQAASWNFNFYQNLVGQGLSERGFVSPIATLAFNYYNYKWEGQFTEDGLIINKIKVIPKRPSDPVWEGYIYITEDTWRIHSLDLSFDDKRPVDFVRSGSIKQVYTKPNQNTEWVILSQNFSFQFKLFGFGGAGYFTKVYADYDLQPQFAENHFGRDLIIVEKESNKKDSLFWKNIRPVPLLAFEAEDYKKKDSLEVVKESKAYQDSIDKISNRFKFNQLFFGYTYRNSYKKYSLGFASPLSEVAFNTVEGLVLNLRVTYQKEFEENRSLEISPTLRYGFSGKTFYGKLAVSYLKNPKYFERWGIEGGKFVEQFNPDAIMTAINTSTTLYQKLNLMKLYEKTYGKISYRREVATGLILNTSAEYAQRNSLQNTTDYSWSRNVNRDYTPNAPFNNELADTDFGSSRALLWSIDLAFTPKQRYINRPDARFRVRSKYPTFLLSYRKGIATLGSNVDFDHLELGLRDTYRWGLVGSGTYKIFAGTFLNTQALTFVDFQHFDGNRTIAALPSFRAYQLLDYYAFSTTKNYAGMHYEHHFNGFFFNRIPLLKKTRIQEVFTCNYLFTETNGNYIEIGAGLEHILKILRIDYFWSFLDGKSLHQGVRFGVGF
ncbi:MAG: DUF5686 and carboxypeptidase regulatory-like domain-containing protein [Raineya sp.]